MQNKKNWWDSYDTMTLAELHEMRDNDELHNVIQYDDNTEPQDIMIRWTIIHPENDRMTENAWIPLDLVACCESEVQTSFNVKNNLYQAFESELQDIDDEDPESYQALLDKYNGLLNKHCAEYEPSIGVSFHFWYDTDKHIVAFCE